MSTHADYMANKEQNPLIQFISIASLNIKGLTKQFFLLLKSLLFHFIVRRNVQWNALMLWLSVRSPAKLTRNISQNAVKITLLSCLRNAGLCKHSGHESSNSAKKSLKMCLKTHKHYFQSCSYICSNAHLGSSLGKVKAEVCTFLDIKILSPFLSQTTSPTKNQRLNQ